MAEGGAGVATARGAAVQCSPEEEAENAEQQETELDMLQSIFEGQILVLNSSQEYLVCILSMHILSYHPLNPARMRCHAVNRIFW